MKHYKHLIILSLMVFSLLFYAFSFVYTFDVLSSNPSTFSNIVAFVYLFAAITYLTMIGLKGHYPAKLILIPIGILVVSTLMLILEQLRIQANLNFTSVSQSFLSQLFTWIEFIVIAVIMIHQKVQRDIAISMVIALMIYQTVLSTYNYLELQQIIQMVSTPGIEKLLFGHWILWLSKLMIYGELILILQQEKRKSSEELMI
jgi:hypothetical protein